MKTAQWYAQTDRPRDFYARVVKTARCTSCGVGFSESYDLRRPIGPESPYYSSTIFIGGKRHFCRDLIAAHNASAMPDTVTKLVKLLSGACECRHGADDENRLLESMVAQR